MVEVKLKLLLRIFIKKITETCESKHGFVIQMFAYTYEFYQNVDKNCFSLRVNVKHTRTKRALGGGNLQECIFTSKSNF